MAYLRSMCAPVKKELPPEVHARDYGASRELRAAIAKEVQENEEAQDTIEPGPDTTT